MKRLHNPLRRKQTHRVNFKYGRLFKDYVYVDLPIGTVLTDLTALKINPAQGAVLASFNGEVPASGLVDNFWQMDSGADTGSTRVSGTISSSGSVRANGSTAQATGGVYVTGAVKASFAWDGTNVYCSLNGANVVSAATASAASFTTFRVGKRVAADSEFIGTIDYLLVFSRKPDNAILKSMTVQLL